MAVEGQTDATVEIVMYIFAIDFSSNINDFFSGKQKKIMSLNFEKCLILVCFECIK